ncbi:hypothetical protein M3B11_03080 [Brevibacterium sp. p3-SID960]|uniref:hypothetical protein n=1 Tax=Brevibacterium sp. p3-SID960 TaxID=2916063 RepID=UPI0021A7B368|nr:hypothetical protein [Brevibacterium sp. p3-SID960]MCT1689949.1 hypothetical protein [Brevibacterium sp. p3-SID960]
MHKLQLMAHKVDVNARTFASAAQEALAAKREKGQGTIEYIGIIVVISVIIAGLVFFFNGEGKTAISEGITDVIDSIFSKKQ